MRNPLAINDPAILNYLTKNVFNCFAEKLNIPGYKFAKILDDNFFTGYENDSDRDKLIKYFANVVVPHKIAVYEAGLELAANTHFSSQLPWPESREIFITQLQIHDISKFSYLEAMGYMKYNFKDKTANDDMVIKNFELAWHHHKMNNPHHPEYWLNPNRSGVIEPLPMPSIYILEMIADWMGAAKTYGGTLEEWLPKNISKFKFKNFAKVAEMITLFTGISVKIDSGNVLICE